jgi:hypothetical protein
MLSSVGWGKLFRFPSKIGSPDGNTVSLSMFVCSVNIEVRDKSSATQMMPESLLIACGIIKYYIFNSIFFNPARALYV